MRKAALLTLVALPMVLSGCSIFGGVNAQLSAHIAPTQLGFEVTDDGLVFATPNVTFTNPANAAQALITDYEVRFFNSSGAPFPDVNNAVYSEHVSIVVPPGYVCADDVVDLAACPLNSRILQVSQSEPEPFVMVPGPVGTVMVANELTVVRAEVTFFAQSGGQDVEWTGDVTVIYPVAGE